MAGGAGMYAAGFQCAGCGEWVETSVDESAGSKQQYVEDCQVCCQPNVLTVRAEGRKAKTMQQTTIAAIVRRWVLRSSMYIACPG
jgi:hypothetical protein